MFTSELPEHFSVFTVKVLQTSYSVCFSAQNEHNRLGYDSF